MEFNSKSGYNIDLANYYWYENGFSDEELMWVDNLQNLDNYYYILNEPRLSNNDHGPTCYGDNTNSEDIVNISKHKTIRYKSDGSWIYDKLKKFVIEANEIIWDFDINSFMDELQHIEYLEIGDHKLKDNNWKMDIQYPASYNKISIIVELTDPSEYEGGEIELWTNGDVKILPKIKGSVILFPSYLLYKINPVIKGNKKILRFWVGGRSFK